MGFLVATNLHQEILVEQGVLKSHKPLVLPEVQPMMALACGKKAISYSKEAGVAVGEDIMEIFFRGNLGFDSMFPPLKAIIIELLLTMLQ